MFAMVPHHTFRLAPEDRHPERRRLPVAAIQSVNVVGDGRLVLHVFCPQVVAAVRLESCRDCPFCVRIETEKGDGERSAVVCGYGSTATPPRTA
jgi:hypothetical protein